MTAQHVTAQEHTEHSERSLRREHIVDLAALVGIVFLLIVVVRMTAQLGHTLALLSMAAALSYLTLPLRNLISRRVGHGVAVITVSIITLAIILGVAFAVTNDITSQATRLASMIDRTIAGLQTGSLPERIASGVNAQKSIHDAFARVGTTVIAGQGSSGGLSAKASDLLVVIVLGAFLQGSGSALVDRVVSLWPRPRRKAVRNRWILIDKKAGALFRGAILLAFGVGSAVAVACWAMAIPGGLILGAWAGLWAPVVTIGPLIGFAPLIGVAFAQTRVTPALAILVAMTLAAGTWAIRGVLQERAGTRPGPATWVLAYAIGYAVVGTPGFVLAFAAVSFVSSFLDTPISGDATEPVTIDRSPLFGIDGNEEWWRSVLTRRGITVMVVTCVLATLAWTLLGSLGVFSAWLFISMLLGVGFDRPVAIILRRVPRIPRAAAAAFVVALFLALVAGVVVLGAQGGASNHVSLSEALPRAVTRFESAPLIGPLLRDHDATRWVTKQLDNLPNMLSKSRDSTTLVPSIGSRFGDLFWALSLTVALLIDGPRIVSELRRRLPVRYRRQFGTFVSISHEAVGGYLAGATVIAVLDALVVLVTALLLKVPLAPALAGWAFLTNFLPQIGGLLGGTPLVILAFTVGPIQAAIAGVVFVLYQFLENHVIGPGIISRAVDISPLASLLAALVGAAAGGMLGALLLTPLVGVYKVIRDIAERGEIPGQQVLLHQPSLQSLPIDKSVSMDSRP